MKPLKISPKAPYIIGKDGKKTDILGHVGDSVDDKWHELMEKRRTKKLTKKSIATALKGGPGSGFFSPQHHGRPGMVGGSSSGAQENPEYAGRKTRPGGSKPLKQNGKVFEHKTASEYFDKYQNKIYDIYTREDAIKKRVLEIKKEIDAHDNLPTNPNVAGAERRWREKRNKLVEEYNEVARLYQELQKEKAALDEEMLEYLHAVGAEEITVENFIDITDPADNNYDEMTAKIKTVLDEMRSERLLSPEITKGAKIIFDEAGPYDSPAYYDYNTGTIKLGYDMVKKSVDEVRIAAHHELGHWIELNSSKSKEVNKRCLDFFRMRTAGEAEKLRGGTYYIKDKFVTEYIGRLYRTSNTKAIVRGIKLQSGKVAGFTIYEVLSTGVEYLLGKPSWFAWKDPEHFKLTVSILMGVPE